MDISNLMIVYRYSIASLINSDVKNTNTYAWMNPSKKSKYRLNGMGRIAGHINSSNFITTKLPRTLPNNRIHNDVGLIASSRMLIGSMIGTGSAKLCRNPLSPRL